MSCSCHAGLRVEAVGVHPEAVLFERRLREGIRDGTITMAFRRWRRRQVVAGRRYRTGDGLVEVEAIDPVEARSITEPEARSAGYPTLGELLRDLQGLEEWPTYRLRLRRVDETDPRQQLADNDRLTPSDVADIDRALDRLDRAAGGVGWTGAALALIATHPGVRAADLAARLGSEVLVFKANVRKLKALSLTISLDVGYRLSPRGREYLRRARWTS